MPDPLIEEPMDFHDVPASGTTDPPSGDMVLLRARRTEEGWWLMTDGATTRFGHAGNLADALADWHEALAEIAHMGGPVGPPIAAEVEWARKVTA